LRDALGSCPGAAATTGPQTTAARGCPEPLARCSFLGFPLLSHTALLFIPRALALLCPGGERAPVEWMPDRQAARDVMEIIPSIHLHGVWPGHGSGEALFGLRSSPRVVPCGMVPPLPVARTPAGLARGTTVAAGETAMAGLPPFHCWQPAWRLGAPVLPAWLLTRPVRPYREQLIEASRLTRPCSFDSAVLPLYWSAGPGYTCTRSSSSSVHEKQAEN
jgi:hypothetical protein